MQILKHVGFIVGMTFIAILCLFLAIYVEVPVLDRQVTTGPSIRLDEWLERFRLWASVGIIAAWLAAVAWYACGQLTNLNDWSRASARRVVWFLLALVPFIALAVAWLATPRAQEGDMLAAAFYFANNIFVYYVATAFFSPSSFKYTPLGATALRRW